MLLGASQPLLVRQDSAQDALEIRLRYVEEDVDFIIKRTAEGRPLRNG